MLFELLFCILFYKRCPSLGPHKTHPFFQCRGHAPFLVLSLGFLCIICINFTVQIVKSMHSHTTVSIAYSSNSWAVFVCVWSKRCVPPSIKSMTKHESTYIDVKYRHLSYKKKKKNYHNQWTRVCTFVKTLKINTTLDSQVSCWILYFN